MLFKGNKTIALMIEILMGECTYHNTNSAKLGLIICNAMFLLISDIHGFVKVDMMWGFV